LQSQLAAEAHTISVIIVDLAEGVGVVRKLLRSRYDVARFLVSPSSRETVAGDIKKASEREDWPIGSLVRHWRAADQAWFSLS